MFVKQEDFLADFAMDQLAEDGFDDCEPLLEGCFPKACRNAGKVFQVHLVETSEQREAVRRIVNKMYGWRGYGENHALEAKDNAFTFAVRVDDEVVGTLTLTVDADEGLAADKTFGDILEGYREDPEASLCELGKFACVSEDDSRFILAALFHAMFVYGTERFNCTDLFIEVNPRHILFYEAMLGFEKIGSSRTNAGVDAPSQLMRLKVADIAANIELYAWQAGKPSTRSLYPFFLSREDEQRMRMDMRVRERAYHHNFAGDLFRSLSNRPTTMAKEAMAFA